MTEQNTLPNSPGRGERNLGVDLLRCVSMLMIAVIHIYNRGGVAAGVNSIHTFAYQSSYLVRQTCMACVDLYALISGYVMLKSRFCPARLLELWLQVVVIGLIECTVGAIVNPELVTPELWKKALMPVTHSEYWYFNAYVGAFVLSPLLNRGIRALTDRQARALLCGVFCVFSGGWLIGKLDGIDCFALSSGYTAFWLVLLYILGACARKTGLWQNVKPWKLLLCAAGCILALWGLRNLFFVQALPKEIRAWGDTLLSYCHPLVVLFSLLLLSVFARVQLHGAAAAFVRWLSPLTFGVYLVHVHPVAWHYFENLYRPLASLRAVLIIPAVLAAGLGLLLCCASLDWLRSLLFRLLRVRKLCDAAGRRVKRLWQETERTGP